MSQSSAIGDLQPPQKVVSPGETHKGNEEYSRPAAIRLQPFSKVNPEETQDVKAQYVSESCSVLFDSVIPWIVVTRCLCPWDFPGKNIGVGCHSLLQGIFSTQGSNSGILHCRLILYCPNHQGSLKAQDTSPRELKCRSKE